MNKTADYELTIVVPVYNEEANMEALEQRLSAFISQPGLSACVLFVNDGSVDQSRERIIEACRRQKHFYHLGLSRNSGLSAALKAGIDTAFSTYVGYMDADLQTTPEDFNLLLPFREDFEMVMGIRTVREDSLVKRTSSKIANGFRRFITKDGITDTGCPLKIMKTSTAKQIPFFNGMHRFLPALVQLQNGRVKEVPVRHFPRVAGQSKYNLRNRLVDPLIDCFAFRWMKSRYLNIEITEKYIE
ncbi:MAG TPA: dolichol-phosphate mannosyltransferase [Prolixibacteraceae bacterium]|nr:dolichol-phosphate mannosyltransferase [Prolixibacteraceae bacterium]